MILILFLASFFLIKNSWKFSLINVEVFHRKFWNCRIVYHFFSSLIIHFSWYIFRDISHDSLYSIIHNICERFMNPLPGVKGVELRIDLTVKHFYESLTVQKDSTRVCTKKHCSNSPSTARSFVWTLWFGKIIEFYWKFDEWDFTLSCCIKFPKHISLSIYSALLNILLYPNITCIFSLGNWTAVTEAAFYIEYYQTTDPYCSDNSQIYWNVGNPRYS